MKKLYVILTLAAIVVSVSSVHAQESRKVVLGIESFSYVSSFTEADAELFRARLINAIQKTGRVTVVDYYTTTDDALEADCILTASLDRLSTTREFYEDKETRKVGNKYETFVKGRYPYMKGSIKYTVRIVDCKDGSVLNQEEYSVDAGSYNSYSHKPDYFNREDARKGVLGKSIDEDKIAVFILNTFKVQGMILQLDEADAKKAKTVYINLGEADGVKRKQIFEVYKELDIAGEISQKLIGEVEVTEVLGPSRSLAKVRKGGDEILRVITSGGNLPIKTREVAALLFGGVK